MNTRSIFIFLLLSGLSSGTAQNKHLSIGVNGNGICFGNSAKYNGIRLNLFDKEVKKINGINISGVTDAQQANGINIGLLLSTDRRSNGLKIGGLFSAAELHNGVAVGGICYLVNKLNGVGISFLSFADTVNGVAIGGWVVGSLNHNDSVQVINGVAIAGFNVYSHVMNGMSVSLFTNKFNILNGVSFAIVNRAKELHGFQFGLLNYAGNNRRIFRWTPFFNFHLKKKNDLRSKT